VSGFIKRLVTVHRSSSSLTSPPSRKLQAQFVASPFALIA
jgi:hypothetical protein